MYVDSRVGDLPDITFMFLDLWMAQSETDMIIIIILVPVPYLIHFSRRRSKLLVLTKWLTSTRSSLTFFC